MCSPKLRRPLELTSLYDDLNRAGKKPTTEVLSFEMVDAEEDVAAGLDLPEGTPVLELVRLRRAGGEPIAKLTNYLPEEVALFDADDLAEHGLYDLIRRQGISLHSATQTLGARTATAAEARMLDESRGAALITAIRITYDDNGKAVEYGTHIYASSRYTFEINLLRPEGWSTSLPPHRAHSSSTGSIRNQLSLLCFGCCLCEVPGKLRSAATFIQRATRS